MSRGNGCRREHRAGEGEGAAARRDPSRKETPAARHPRQGVPEKMAGVKLVLNPLLFTGDGVEHMGPNSKLCQTSFRLLIHRHSCFSDLGTCGLFPMAPVCVADGQEG